MENFSIARSELMHYRLQAFLREFNCSDIEYIGLRNSEHWYKIDGHEVNVKDIEEFDQIDDDEQTVTY
jgi:hypothetical protein